MTGARPAPPPPTSRLTRRTLGRPGWAARLALDRCSRAGSGARYRVTTVFEKPNGFCGFFSLFSTDLQPPWSPASRPLKTRKPGPRDQVPNTDYPSEAAPKSGCQWWAGVELNHHTF